MAYEIITWQDHISTGARGWLVIDRLINGVSGGGLFITEDASLEQVTNLAEIMSLKNQLNDFQFGGAKAGIKFNPHHPEKLGVMERFLLHVKKQLSTIWSTGADVNTTNEEINSVCINNLELESPFYSLGAKIAKFYGIQNQSKFIFEKTNLLVDDLFPIADYATAFFVAESINLTFKRKNIKPKILIHGFGKIGKCLFYLLQKTSHIVGIGDHTGFVLLNDNILYLNKQNIKKKRHAKTISRTSKR